MGLSDWASLALICLLGASSPGPSLIVILGNTRLYGRKATGGRIEILLERLLDELLFSAPEIGAQKILITKDYVRERLSDLAADDKLANYIL